MYRRSLALSLSAVAVVLGSPVKRNPCAEVQIPISVSVPRFIINTTIQDNWDATAFTFNLTRRDSAIDAILVAGSTSSSINSTYTVGATLCGHGGPTLVLTHGIIESKLYWRPNLDNTTQYSFVDAAIAAGYSILSYDRIGVGSSSKIDSFSDAQFQVETAVLNSLVDYARTVGNATQVALFGHSYGAYLSAASASETDVDAVILTGFSGKLDYFGPFLAGSGFRVASIEDPARWGALDSGFLTTSDLYAETFAYYAEPYFEHRIAEWSYAVSSEPFGAAELLSLLHTTVHFEDIAAPVLMLQGQYDVSACGGDCVGLLDSFVANFTTSKAVKIVDDLPAGHNLNLHKIAPQAFEIVFDFLKEQGV
ncbi:putative Alpha/beta-hydrolase [Seiridium unicorne]|uniref:Alpha/beta-hydrolase n=1 Tax=Seiridium unicorne TaxID=138068 RepID=A0ABR2V5T2_9PEZI